MTFALRGGGENQQNANACEWGGRCCQLIRTFAHKLLRIITRFFVSFVKITSLP